MYMNAYICVYIHIQGKIDFHLAFSNSISFLYQMSIEIFGKLYEYWGGAGCLIYCFIIYYLFISVFLGTGSCKEKGFPLSCSSHPATALFSRNKTVSVRHYHKNMGGEYSVCRTASQNL